MQPKVVISENVKGILFGNAKEYTRNILKAYDNAGYQVKHFVLDASKMGVPQRRERVFFIAIRKDLAEQLPKQNNVLFADYPALNMTFNESEIPFSEIKTSTGVLPNFTEHDQYVWSNRKKGDKKYSDVLERIENRCSNFNAAFVYNNRTVSTISSSEGSKLTLFDEPRKMNTTEMIKAQSFPLDYDFGSDKASKVQYVLGMSVPPIMMARITDRIYNEWKIIFNNEEKI